MSRLPSYLKKSSTLVIDHDVNDCPACGCPRFEPQPLTMLDKLASRKARYQCTKCETVTLIESFSDERRGEKEEHDELASRKKFLLGIKYATGNGVNKNEKAAFICFKEAAELGHTDAQYNLGVYMVKGIGVGQNIKLGTKWLETAADAGHEKAIKALPSVQKLDTN